MARIKLSKLKPIEPDYKGKRSTQRKIRKPGRSNAKGGGFERKICRALTKWITGHEHPEIFWRSATSGAKATQDAKKGHKSKMGGDIVAVDSKGQWFTDGFSIECKNRKSFGHLDLLFEGRGKFLEWWGQCCSDADRAGKMPLMIFKRLQGPVLVAQRHGELPLNPSGWKNFMDFYHHVNVEGTGGWITILPFADWLAGSDPKELKRALRRKG